MAGTQLTEGAIAKITSGGGVESDFKPRLQVTELKQVQTKQPQQSDRFRLVLSDGTHLQQAMLATQINHLVKEGNLKSGSLVQLVQFTCTSIQGRMIIIILDLVVIAEECALIGNPVSLQRSLGSVQQPPADQLGNSTSGSLASSGGNVQTHNSAAPPIQGHGMNQFQSSAASFLQGQGMNQFQNHSQPTNYNQGRHAASSPYGSRFNGPTPSNGLYNNPNVGLHNVKSEVAHAYQGNYSRPPQSAYQQPPPMYSNRGPVAKNEAPPRIIPIAALNPYQGRWTIKARVTAKGELRRYSNPRGDGKVFAFDLLDSEGGEIRVTCFNDVADKFYHQIEAGRVYLISRGNLKPAQKSFNHLHNDLEIFLEGQSTIQPCFDDDNSIPKQQFHFRPISDVESMDNNSVVDVIGVVTSITPTTSIMRKNGTETQKRSLHLKDMSGRSVEMTLWGNFCYAEGQRLQSLCDSGGFPVLAVKSCRISDFNGKAVGTILSSQLLIDPDVPEAQSLKEWFDKEGRSTPSVSISREMSSTGRMDVLKTISQIKDEKLGTSEKPDWITVNANVIFIKADNFCYTACPIMVGDRPCSKKVVNNGDGKWRCERCDQSVDECDYRYILRFQIQDHTGLTWVTAFQECGEEIMGISAKELHYLKHENQDDDGFSKILRQVLFTRFMFKLKVKEETFSDEQRVNSTVVKAERVNYSSHSRSLLEKMEKFKLGNEPSFASKSEANNFNPGVEYTEFGGGGSRQIWQPVPNVVNHGYAGGELGLSANQVGQYGNQYGTRFSASNTFGSNMHCNSCGATGHNSVNCPSIMSAPGQSVGGAYSGRVSSGASMGAPIECFKCHQVGHWARDCPGVSSVPLAYGSSNMSSGRFGGASRQHVDGF